MHTTTFYFGVGWLKVQTLPHFEQNEALQRPLVKRVSTVKTDHVGALGLVKREERIARPQKCRLRMRTTLYNVLDTQNMCS